ncbi:hypothetical protein ACJVC5_07545 [Peredibacter sp. HCB2-198]|uniref:hypothetical protein n=1 Tax=Peredibacter sp. HCB2-198 TaxID=3383025 RepID=UPI0038B41D83
MAVTLWLLFFGPLAWPLRNLETFLILIFLYHIAFVSGYLGKIVNSLKPKRSIENKSDWAENLFVDKFWIVILLAFIGCLISHRNLVHSDSYIPWAFFSEIKRGILHASEVRTYYASPEFAGKFTGNKYVTALLLVLSFFKYILLPGMIMLWERLSLPKKILGTLVVLIPVASGISISLSSINFAYLFTTFICLGVLILQTRSFFILKSRKTFIIGFFILFIFTILNFYQVKTKASFSEVSSGKAVPVRMDYLREKGVVFKNDQYRVKITAFEDLYEKLSVYLVNGYVGMSISLDKDFQSAFGVGHSTFLQRVFDQHLGLDISSRTYQQRISTEWDKDIFWHSAYSYFANDVSFYGVILVMFIFGFYLASISINAFLYKDFIASLLMPLFGIFILYLPANNQIFSFIETMIPFWLLSIIYIGMRTDLVRRVRSYKLST